MRYLLDTDTCIDVLRGVSAVVAHLRALASDDCAISVITSFELYAGVAKARQPARETQKIKLLLEVVRELPFAGREAQHAGQLRAQLEIEGRPLGAYDLLIAGHSLAAGLILVTANTKDFGRVENLPLENWR